MMATSWVSGEITYCRKGLHIELRCVFVQRPFDRGVLPVYLCIRNRDVVCGILNQQAVDCFLQVWPVVFPVVFYCHRMQDWVTRGERVRCETSFCTTHLILVEAMGPVKPTLSLCCQEDHPLVNHYGSNTPLSDYRISGPAVSVCFKSTYGTWK